MCVCGGGGGGKGTHTLLKHIPAARFDMSFIGFISYF